MVDPIDLREFGRLEATVAAQGREIGEVKDGMHDLSEKLDKPSHWRTRARRLLGRMTLVSMASSVAAGSRTTSSRDEEAHATDSRMAPLPANVLGAGLSRRRRAAVDLADARARAEGEHSRPWVTATTLVILLLGFVGRLVVQESSMLPIVEAILTFLRGSSSTRTIDSPLGEHVSQTFGTASRGPPTCCAWRSDG